MLKFGFLNAITRAINIGLSILTIPVLIRILGLESYGLWILVSSGVYLVTLAESGLPVSATYFISRDISANDSQRLAQSLTIIAIFVLTIASGIFAVMWFGADIVFGPISSISPDQLPVAIETFRIGSLFIWAFLLQQALVGIVQAYQRYLVLNILNSVQTILSKVGVLIAAATYGIYAMMAWQSLISFLFLIAFGIIVWRLTRETFTGPAWNKEKAIQIIRYSGYNWLSSLGSRIFTQADRIIVGALLGPAVLGVYGAITSIAIQITFMSGTIVQPLLPSLSFNSVGKRSPETDTRILASLRQTVQFNAFVALGMGAVLFVARPFVMAFLDLDYMVPAYGQSYWVIITVYALFSLNAIGFFGTLGIGAVELNTLITITSGLGAVVLIAVFSHSFGLIGASVGNAAFMLTLAMNLVVLRRLSIPLATYLTWLRFPLLWFVAVIILLPSLPISTEVQFGIFVIFGIALSWWFLANQRDVWKPRVAKYLERSSLPR